MAIDMEKETQQASADGRPLPKLQVDSSQWKFWVPSKFVLSQYYSIINSGQLEKAEKLWEEHIEAVPIEFRLDVAEYITEMCRSHLMYAEDKKEATTQAYSTMAYKFLGNLRVKVSRELGYTPQAKKSQAEPTDVFAMVEKHHRQLKSLFSHEDQKIQGTDADPWGMARSTEDIYMDILDAYRVTQELTQPIKLKNEVDEGNTDKEGLEFTEEFLDRVQEICRFKTKLVVVPFKKFDVFGKWANGIDPTDYAGGLPAKICLGMIWTISCSWGRYPLGYTDLEERVAGCIAALGLYGYRVKDYERFISAIWLYSAKALPAEIVGRNIALATELA